LNSFEDHEENHRIIYNGTKIEFPQPSSNNGVRIIVVVARIEK
jgi:hypothetical protein